MKVYIGFDDTDNLDADIGTGKLARRFETLLPEGTRLQGVVRQQLLVDDRIPYTSHNSSACLIVEVPEIALLETLRERAVGHIEKESLTGSDPGLCIAWGDNGAFGPLMEFGRLCTERVVTQAEALTAAGGFHLTGHGGTNDGIIGAAAAVGLTASGWSGRFIEYERLRDLPGNVTVGELEMRGMRVVSMDRDGVLPRSEDRVDTKGWLRPRLLGHRAVVPVLPSGNGLWYTLWEKRSKKSHGR
jgi:tRNA(Ile2) C34 agmatinyltransferase TiaS